MCSVSLSRQAAICWAVPVARQLGACGATSVGSSSAGQRLRCQAALAAERDPAHSDLGEHIAPARRHPRQRRRIAPPRRIGVSSSRTSTGIDQPSHQDVMVVQQQPCRSAPSRISVQAQQRLAKPDRSARRDRSCQESAASRCSLRSHRPAPTDRCCATARFQRHDDLHRPAQVLVRKPARRLSWRASRSPQRRLRPPASSGPSRPSAIGTCRSAPAPHPAHGTAALLQRRQRQDISTADSGSPAARSQPATASQRPPLRRCRSSRAGAAASASTVGASNSAADRDLEPSVARMRLTSRIASSDAVAAEREEVVVDADLLQPQHLGKQRAQHLLLRRARRRAPPSASDPAPAAHAGRACRSASAAARPEPQTPTAPCSPAGSRQACARSAAASTLADPAPPPHRPPAASARARPRAQSPPPAPPPAWRTSAASISPGSMRKPRSFTCWSARPRNSSTPSARQRARSPVRYIRLPAAPNGSATNRSAVSPARSR